jgi:hypothetical protein
MWKQAPPFPGDSAYGEAVLDYRRKVLERHERLAAAQGGVGDFHDWFLRHRESIESEGGLLDYARAAVGVVLAEYERAPQGVEALGALNRWPGRAALPLSDYLREWGASCRELGASTVLPAALAARFGKV